MDDIDKIYEFNKHIHRLGIEMAKDAGKAGAHVGGSFSCMEILSVLYGAVLRYDVSNRTWDNRDRFIASKAHCILAHFASLSEAGFIKKEDLMSFHSDNGLLVGHPWNIEIGLEFPGGSLGMGLSVGIGMALNAKRKKQSFITYVLIGDGETNEGAVWEAVMSATKFNLDNLVAIVDFNNMQFDGKNDDIMPVSSISEKFKSFGWSVIDVEGHSIEQLYEAFQTSHIGKPLAIVAHTIKAKGIPALENKAESHHSSISQEDYDYVINQIERGRYDRFQ